MSSGVILRKKVGDFVKKGDVLFEFHTNKIDYLDPIGDMKNAFEITDKKVERAPIVREYIH